MLPAACLIPGGEAIQVTKIQPGRGGTDVLYSLISI